MSERYFVVPAPGHYGDTGTVSSSHATLRSALRAASWEGLCVRVGDKRKGDTWLRVYEETYPLASSRQRATRGTIAVKRLLSLTSELDTQACAAAESAGVNVTEWWRLAGLAALKRNKRRAA